MRWIQYIATSLGNPLNLSASRAATQRDFNRGDGLSGNTAASFLLGTLSSGSSDLNLLPTYLYRYYAPWIQDDWRISSRLTLNLGLRWDFNVPANERYNRMNRGFDLTLTNPVDKLIDRTKFPGFLRCSAGSSCRRQRPAAQRRGHLHEGHPAALRICIPTQLQAGDARRMGPLLQQSEQCPICKVSDSITRPRQSPRGRRTHADP
jgi:hypothetical protein